MSDYETVTITANRDLQSAAENISFPDDYSLDDLTLLTPVQNVNIKALMNELSIFEDIFRGAVTGHILITDTLSLIDKLVLTGNEFIKMKFRKHKKADKSFERIFRLVRVGERNRINHDTEMYTLHFCSEDFVLSEQTKISKSYKGKTISEMVEDILVNELKVPGERYSLYPTTGTYDFIIPYKKPLEAIHWLSNYAMNEKYRGADYVFFETANGYRFESLQHLYTAAPKRQYTFNPKGVSTLSDIGELASLLSNIKSYKFIDTFDTLYGTSSGIFANRLLTIDPLTRTYRDTTFTYSGNESKKLNNGTLINNYKNKKGLLANQCYDSVYKVMFSNSEQRIAEGIKGKEYAVSSDIYAEKYVPYRTSQLAASNYSRIQFTIAGDPSLTVGKTIILNLPSNATDKTSAEKDGHKDEMHSGKYLITAVRHILDTNMRYETVVEVSKDSFGMSSANYDYASLNRIKDKT